jgi:hypothetical protein
MSARQEEHTQSVDTRIGRKSVSRKARLGLFGGAVVLSTALVASAAAGTFSHNPPNNNPMPRFPAEYGRVLKGTGDARFVLTIPKGESEVLHVATQGSSILGLMPFIKAPHSSYSYQIGDPTAPSSEITWTTKVEETLPDTSSDPLKQQIPVTLDVNQPNFKWEIAAPAGEVITEVPIK